MIGQWQGSGPSRLPPSPENQPTSQDSDAYTGRGRERRRGLGSVHLSEIVCLGIVTRRPMGAVVQGHLENLRQMQGLAVSGLGDLSAAAKAIRYDERLLVGLAYGWEQCMLANGQRHIVVAGLKAKRTSHAATPGVEHLIVETKLGEPLGLRVHAHDGLVMAVAVHDRLALQLWGLVLLCCVHEKFTEQVDALTEPSGVLVIGKEIAQLVPEDRYAAWLEAHD